MMFQREFAKSVTESREDLGTIDLFDRQTNIQIMQLAHIKNAHHLSINSYRSALLRSVELPHRGITTSENRLTLGLNLTSKSNIA